ncbi:MAG TPA: DUF4349 domain-containing protein [Thermoleophilaceae bacterium]|nr:DUF4349 domain-containing protein [Thermoleophilaceae bacterium]
MTNSDEAFERDLALALAAEAPRARPGFKDELRERVDAGFPRERRFKVPSISRRKLMPALAVATCAVVAVSVVGLNRDERAQDTGMSAPASGGGAAAEQAPDATVAPSPEPRTDLDFAPGRERRIERSARMSLVAPEDRLEKVGQGIVDVAERYRGYVLSSSLGTGEDEGGGTYELRVPAADLRDALRDLGRLGTVRSQSQNGQDVTAGYVSAADRLQSARAERRSLLRRLERSGSDTQTEALRRRLELNALRVSAARNQVRELRTRTDYAAVSVTLSSRDDGTVTGGNGDGLGGALDDALGSLSDSVELLVRALGVGIPIGVLALLAWIAARTLRRRRREAIL